LESFWRWENAVANLLLRAAGAAESLMGQGGQWLPARQLRLVSGRLTPHWIAATALNRLARMRWQYGAYGLVAARTIIGADASTERVC